MDTEKIEKLPVSSADVVRHDYEYTKEKPYIEASPENWTEGSASHGPTQPVDTTRTQHIENIESRQSSTPSAYVYKDPPPLTRRQKIKKHFKRFWICYVIGLIVGLAAGLPIIFLVIFPALAQRLVDSADLPIHETQLMSPTPDSIEVSLVASLKVPLGLSVRLEPTELHLYRPETKPFTPYVTVSLPAQRLKGNTTIRLESQRVQIANMSEFETFLRDAVYAEDFELSARGSTTAWLGKLKADITLDKAVKMKGLNQLKGFNIMAAQALLPPVDGANLAGSVKLPNPSIVGFELGVQTLDLVMPGGLVVGQGVIHNATIAPGDNIVDFTGNLDYETVFGNVENVLNVQAEALARGNLALDANGNSTVFNGIHIPYYEKILNNMTLSAEVPVTQLLTGTLGGVLNQTSGPIGDIATALTSLNLTQILGQIQGAFPPPAKS